MGNAVSCCLVLGVWVGEVPTTAVTRKPLHQAALQLDVCGACWCCTPAHSNSVAVHDHGQEEQRQCMTAARKSSSRITSSGSISSKCSSVKGALPQHQQTVDISDGHVCSRLLVGKLLQRAGEGAGRPERWQKRRSLVLLLVLCRRHCSACLPQVTLRPHPTAAAAAAATRCTSTECSCRSLFGAVI